MALSETIRAFVAKNFKGSLYFASQKFVGIKVKSRIDPSPIQDKINTALTHS